MVSKLGFVKYETYCLNIFAKAEKVPYIEI